MLHVTTTHFKQMFIQRNGVPGSPYAVMHEFFIRHGDRLLLIFAGGRPGLPRRADGPHLDVPVESRGSARARLPQVDVAEEVPGLRQGDVPHYPLGSTHPEYADENKLPFEATLGGKETLYPGVRGEACSRWRSSR